jgi:Zn-finger nucleic acid-binding protein
MKCPVCRVDLVMADRAGVEIDYCSKCRGVWLDRGELDKIVERSATDAPAASAGGYEAWDESRRISGEGYGPTGRPRKRKSFLGELFDFG